MLEHGRELHARQWACSWGVAPLPFRRFARFVGKVVKSEPFGGFDDYFGKVFAHVEPGNGGHEGKAYGTELSAAEKTALVEFLKTF